jgi:hypothetical protein
MMVAPYFWLVMTSLQASETKRFSAAGDYTCATVHLLHSRARAHCVRRPSTCSTRAATEASRPLAFPFPPSLARVSPSFIPPSREFASPRTRVAGDLTRLEV